MDRLTLPRTMPSDPDGRPTPGLSALGRNTKDLVIGNDILGRSLHPEGRLWAERLAGTTRA
ncbi:MAG: hypothetical protein L0G49_00395 [Luteococcus sp.]|uniref:hypothetical protein n=1 Tax=Luteococcus sp. TaxID=1969402 RepID=UPI0026498B7B|nr:hypothetical protein [Luteococcus sp.]MDN5562235.1 hypothetical protein [Luteococcus sp.]